MTIDILARYGLHPDELPNKRLTRSGLRKVLKHVYEVQAATEHADWELLWRANLFAGHEALKVWHRRIPKRLYAIDKAKVAWYLQRSGTPLVGPAAKAWRWTKT